MSTVTPPLPPYQRLKAAAWGFAVTALPLAAIGMGQFLIARHTVLVVGGMNPDVDTWAVIEVQQSLAPAYTTIACVVAIYWLVTAALSRGHFLTIKSANATLALSCFAFGCAIAIMSTVPAPARVFESACPYLDLPDTYYDSSHGFGFDVPTACEAFAHNALRKILLGLPGILLAISAILRISLSRYHTRG
jgi:hypothetical protein